MRSDQITVVSDLNVVFEEIIITMCKLKELFKTVLSKMTGLLSFDLVTLTIQNSYVKNCSVPCDSFLKLLLSYDQ